MLKRLARGAASLIMLAIATTTVLAQNENQRYAVKDHGIPAYPDPIRFEQPDGKTVTLTLKGDGALHWAETEDGYMLVKKLQRLLLLRCCRCQQGHGSL